MKASEAVQILGDGNWVSPLCYKTFPDKKDLLDKSYTPPKSCGLTEFTIRYPTDEKTYWDDDKYKNYRLDMLFLIQSDYKAMEERLFTVGFEIKVSASDLKSDEKFRQYLGWTNYFFFAVPDDLVHQAVEKIKNESDNQFIGLYNLSRQELVIEPEIQPLTDERQKKVYREMCKRLVLDDVKEIQNTRRKYRRRRR